MILPRRPTKKLYSQQKKGEKWTEKTWRKEHFAFHIFTARIRLVKSQSNPVRGSNGAEEIIRKSIPWIKKIDTSKYGWDPWTRGTGIKAIRWINYSTWVTRKRDRYRSDCFHFVQIACFDIQFDLMVVPVTLRVKGVELWGGDGIIIKRRRLCEVCFMQITCRLGESESKIDLDDDSPTRVIVISSSKLRGRHSAMTGRRPRRQPRPQLFIGCRPLSDQSGSAKDSRWRHCDVTFRVSMGPVIPHLFLRILLHASTKVI